MWLINLLSSAVRRSISAYTGIFAYLDFICFSAVLTVSSNLTEWTDTDPKCKKKLMQKPAAVTQMLCADSTWNKSCYQICVFCSSSWMFIMRVQHRHTDEPQSPNSLLRQLPETRRRESEPPGLRGEGGGGAGQCSFDLGLSVLALLRPEGLACFSFLFCSGEKTAGHRLSDLGAELTAGRPGGEVRTD